MKYCCMKFNDMIDDSRIQHNDIGGFIIWTCTGNVGEYPMYDDPDCDGINFCPWCSNKLVSTD